MLSACQYRRHRKHFIPMTRSPEDSAGILFTGVVTTDTVQA
jgi:hypothetical protein